MKRDFHIAILISFFILVFTAISATSLYATNGHQLSAIGAYQQGMAGATTAAPYDATTAVSNPAGMAMIGTRTDFSFQTFFPSRSVSFENGGESSGGSNWYLVPAIGWTAPTDDRQDLFFGGGMYGVSGMGVDYDTVDAPAFGGPGDQAHIWSQYQFWKMAPTVAWKNEKLALGFALNLDYQAFGFENYFTGGLIPGGYLGFDLSEMQGALGFGAAVGFIYTPVPAFRVGASYTSKQYFGDFKWRLSAGDVIWRNGEVSQNGIYKMSLDFPQQAAVGIAVRPFRNFLWTVDVKWIQYSDTYDIVYLKGDFGGGINEVGLNFGWDDVWVYATGFQFDITPKFAFRMGYNHSTSPIKKEDVENNLAFPAIVEDRVAGGFTYRFGRHWEITMAYMHAMREQLTGISGTTISLEEEAADFELSYRF